MKELFRKIIFRIYGTECKKFLVFESYNSCYCYVATGDCCSESWFENIENPENLIAEEIIGVEIKQFSSDIIDKTNDDYHADDGNDCIELYGYTLKTSKGHTDIEYRNASNGYYGGDCEYLPLAKVEGNLLKPSPYLDETFTLINVADEG